MSEAGLGEKWIDSAGTGPPVVLIHGLGLDRFLWDPFVTPLSAHFRIIRYDLLGHGAAPPLTGPVTLADFDAQLADVLDGIAIARAGLIGFSLGGVIARSFAARHPDRVAGMVLLNTIATRPPDIKHQVMDRADRLDRGETGTLAAEAIERWFTPDFREQRPDAIAAVLDRLDRNDETSYRHAYRLFAEVDEEVTLLHPQIKSPTLVVTGQDDRNSTPDMARSIAATIDGADWRSLPGLRHMALVENPATVIDCVLPFLKRIT